MDDMTILEIIRSGELDTYIGKDDLLNAVYTDLRLSIDCLDDLYGSNYIGRRKFLATLEELKQMGAKDVQED